MSRGVAPRARLPLPDGFAWIEGAGARLAVDAGLQASLDALGLLAPAALARALARGEGRGGRAPTARLVLPEGVLVLRALWRGGLLGPWLGGASLDPARPFRELFATAALLAAGAPVPRPAIAAAWPAGLGWNAAVATWLESDAVDAAAFLAARPERPRLVRALAAGGRAVRRFHDAGGWHADLHVGNLLVREAASRCEVLLVDLDGARAGTPPDPARRLQELMRLYRSLRKRGLLAAVGERGCAAFFGAYVGRDRALRARMRARLGHERRRVALHALAYPR